MFEKKAFIFPRISPSIIQTRNNPVNPKDIKGFDKERPIAIADRQRISHPLVLEKMVLILMAKDTYIGYFFAKGNGVSLISAANALFL